jgi:hypothetical protein
VQEKNVKTSKIEKVRALKRRSTGKDNRRNDKETVQEETTKVGNRVTLLDI